MTISDFLITGGAGFIGSHLTDSLISDGYRVKILDDLSTGNLANLDSALKSDRCEFIQGSILDQDLVEKCVEDTKHVIHLAAAVGVFNIVNNPLESFYTNFKGTENIVKFSAKRQIPILFASTSEIYGKNSQDFLDEDSDRILGSPSLARWSYAEAKALDEFYLLNLSHKFNFDLRIIRFFNTVGPRQVGTYGMVIPRFVQAALKGQPLQVFGDGSQTRCFMHIEDAVNGIRLILDSKKAVGKAINLGNHDEVSILFLARSVVDQLNSKSEIELIPYSDVFSSGFEDMLRRVPNTSLLKSLTGWEIQHSLSQIILDVSKGFIHQS